MVIDKSKLQGYVWKQQSAEAMEEVNLWEYVCRNNLKVSWNIPVYWGQLAQSSHSHVDKCFYHLSEGGWM